MPCGIAGGRCVIAAAMPFVGKSVPRLEDRPLVTGRGAYAADISLSGGSCGGR